MRSGHINVGASSSAITQSGKSAPDISAYPIEENFGNVDIGTLHKKGLTISNNGDADLLISSIALSGGDRSKFSIFKNTCPSLTPTLTAGSSCTLNIGFNPTVMGGKSTTVRLQSNDPDENPFDVAVNGIGILCPIIFNDVPPGAFARDYILTVACNGITAGCGENNFCPDTTVTRAQMAVFLLKAIGEQPAPTCTDVFDDVNNNMVGESFCKYVEKFSTLGITAGCGSNNFCPNDPVTRAQMAVFLTKAMGEQPATSCTGTVFNDVSSILMSDAFCMFIEKFSTLGITSGCGGGNFCPDDFVSRAQMAVFLTKGFLQ